MRSGRLPDVDEDEIDKLLRELGLELPDGADDAPLDEVDPRLTDLDEWGWQ
jgi:hypothetical protein